MGVNVSQMDEDKGIEILYRSGWDGCYLHYTEDDGQTWTDLPGVPFEKCDEGEGWYRVFLESRERISFAINDGRGNWDNPRKQKNYEITSTGSYVLKGGKVSTLTMDGISRVLVVSDLDGTMIGDDRGTKDFSEVWYRELSLREGHLVYNTGRSLSSYVQVQKEKSLPQPTALITAVGSEIYWISDSNEPVLDEEWAQSLRINGWNRKAVLSACNDVVASDKAHYRPADEQLEFKIVLGVKKSDLDEVQSSLSSRIEADGGKAKLVVSGSGEWRFLDILSPTAGKLSAMQRVREKLGFEPEQTVACGDSGNDIAMMEGTERAIIVGNAQEELLDWYKSNKDGNEDRIYVSDKRCAHAIIQGLRSMGFVVDN